MQHQLTTHWQAVQQLAVTELLCNSKQMVFLQAEQKSASLCNIKMPLVSFHFR